MIGSAPRQDFLATLKQQPPDGLLALIQAFRDDPHPGKIDLGVGVYRDENGATPVFRSVKAAEAILVETQTTKSYLGPEGDLGFLDGIRKLAFGEGFTGNLACLQTPGGTGALRLAAELANASRPGARIWLGMPTWPNHAQIFDHVGLESHTYRYFDPASQSLCFNQMMEALGRADPGDLILLHACCHNPTGADPSPDQWRAITEIVAARGLVPLIDLAYQGLAQALEVDAASLRMLVDAVDTALVCYSCDKNFGLYRERTGAFYVKAAGAVDRVQSNLLQLARCAWSMPPDHGAAVVRVILNDAELIDDWRVELATMCARLRAVRQTLGASRGDLAPIAGFNGLFAQLPLDAPTIETLRREHGVYLAGGGRINVAGLQERNIPVFVDALKACLPGANR